MNWDRIGKGSGPVAAIGVAALVLAWLFNASAESLRTWGVTIAILVGLGIAISLLIGLSYVVGYIMEKLERINPRSNGERREETHDSH